MRKKIFRIIYFMLALTLLPAMDAEAFAAPVNSAEAVVLLHPETGTVLYQENADERMLIASTTKVMTALVVLDYCLPSDSVRVDLESTLVEGSSMYLKAGETYTVENLLYGLLLVSGNDAALALARHVAGDAETFASLMTKKAESMGLKNTSFKNPHGLDADGHYSSAYDLAVIMSYAMKNNVFREITGTRSYKLGDQTYINHNKLLWNYDGVIGGKTGYTVASGRSLISCAERDGILLVCVTLGDPDDWYDHSALYDWVFETYEYKSAVPAGEYARIPVVSGEAESVGVATDGDIRVLARKDAELLLKPELPRFVFAGVRAGGDAGELHVYVDGEEAGSIRLCYTESVGVGEGIKLTAWERFKRAWYLTNRYMPYGYGYQLT